MKFFKTSNMNTLRDCQRFFLTLSYTASQLLTELRNLFKTFLLVAETCYSVLSLMLVFFISLYTQSDSDVILLVNFCRHLVGKK